MAIPLLNGWGLPSVGRNRGAAAFHYYTALSDRTLCGRYDTIRDGVLYAAPPTELGPICQRCTNRLAHRERNGGSRP